MEHEFSHPRNLYEKLERDSLALERETNGDNFFNFITTAYHLQDWIKRDDGLQSEAAIKRLLKKLHDEPYVQLCSDILEAKKHFRVTVDIITNDVVADVRNERIIITEMKNIIMGIYQSYFHLK